MIQEGQTQLWPCMGPAAQGVKQRGVCVCVDETDLAPAWLSTGQGAAEVNTRVDTQLEHNPHMVNDIRILLCLCLPSSKHKQYFLPTHRGRSGVQRHPPVACVQQVSGAMWGSGRSVYYSRLDREAVQA